MILIWKIIDILALLTFGMAIINAQRNFKITKMHSTVWDFVVLLAAFGSMWAMAWLFDLTVLADFLFVFLIALTLALVLLSSQDNLQPA